MKLSFLDIGTLFNKFENQSLFNISTYSICSSYLGKLRKSYETNDIVKVRIEFLRNLPEVSELPKPLPKEIKDIAERRKRYNEGTYFYQNFIEKYLDVVIIHRRFDFEKWFAAEKTDKKRMIVEEIHGGMLYLAEHFGWEKEPLILAFEACKSANYENAWIVEKLGNKTSANRKLKAAVYVEYDIDEFRTFAIISDKEGNLIQKTQIHTINFLNKNIDIPDDIFDILKGKTKWEKTDFVLLNKKNVEIGRISVNFELSKS